MDIKDRITVSIPVFEELSGLGHTKTYELIGREIESVLVGRRRLIVVASYLAFLERQKQAQAAGIGRIDSPNPRAATNGSALAVKTASQKKGRRIASPAGNVPSGPNRRSRGRPPNSRPVRP